MQCMTYSYLHLCNSTPCELSINSYIFYRNTENNDNDKHISECIDNIKEDYIIDNNGTKFNLFYNIFNIINTVYREKREIIESKNND